MHYHFKDAADRVAGTQREIDLFFHARFVGLVDAAQFDLFLQRKRCDLGPACIAAQLCPADAHHVAQHGDAEGREQQLGDGSGCDTRGGLTRRRPFKYIACIREVVLERACQISMARPRRGDRLVFERIARTDGKNVGPVLPVTILYLHRYG